jgi:hypothetical protein
MALTLVEASKYSNDVLQKGIIELLVKDDPILTKLQFKDVKGNGLTYNEETTLSGADFFNPNDEWRQSESTVTQRTVNTKILGGDADVDNFLRVTRGNMQDLMAEQVASKTKAIKRAFLDAFYYGYFTGGNTKDFDGVHYLIRRTTAGSENSIAVATSSGTSLALSLERVEAAKDLIKGDEEPSVAVTTKLMRRQINKYLNGVGGITKTEIQGKTVQTLFDVPLVVTDHLRNNESADLQYGTNEASTAVYGHNYADSDGGDDDGGCSIFYLKFSPEAVCGIQSQALTTEKFPKLENKDGSRIRIKWYAGLMFQSLIQSSKVTGIDADGTVAA